MKKIWNYDYFCSNPTYNNIIIKKFAYAMTAPFLR